MTLGLLVLGFGGPVPGCCGRRPDCPRLAGCEAECFVSGILGDNPARSARVEEITQHYRLLGGFSGYNRFTWAQAGRLGEELGRRGQGLPIVCAFRHAAPWARDGLAALAKQGVDRVLLLIMAPHQSSVSWDWYLRYAAESAQAMGPGAPTLIGAVDACGESPGFIAAIADRLREATAHWSAERLNAARLVFTAHAVPEPVARSSQYCAQFARTAALAAQAFGKPDHLLAYQSAPGGSGVPWTGPDILTVVAEAAREGVRDLLVHAAGFLVDHTEVIYDLDIEAGGEATRQGMQFTRSSCVQEHPAFIGGLADAVVAAMGRLTTTV